MPSPARTNAPPHPAPPPAAGAPLRRAPRREAPLSPVVLFGGGAFLVLLVGGLFWAVWKTQFAAPPGYLFETPSLAIEAGYCLNVAQMIVPGGAPIGSYFDEAAQFWVKRLRGLNTDMAGAIAQGRTKLARDQMAAGPKANVWFQYAMDQCSNRAVTYGAHFRSFD